MLPLSEVCCLLFPESAEIQSPQCMGCSAVIYIINYILIGSSHAEAQRVQTFSPESLSEQATWSTPILSSLYQLCIVFPGCGPGHSFCLQIVVTAISKLSIVI